MSPRLRAALYAQAGAVFSLHPCLYAGDRPTAGRSRFATLLPGDAAVSPSNGDHAGTQRADPPPPRNGPKHRGASRSRSATGPPRQSRSTRQFFCAEVLGGDTGAVKAFAQAAEELGYDHIVIYDHVLGAVHAGREPKLTGPYKEGDPFHEPLVTYAYLAGLIQKLELVTGVIILPQRQTALFAKQAADVDLFSGGRLRRGVGVGWNWVEYDGLEMSRHFRRRGKRQEQQIGLIRKLWQEPVLDYEDSDHRIKRAGILPRPKRQIPIWLGGSSEAAFDRAARIGDG